MLSKRRDAFAPGRSPSDAPSLRLAAPAGSRGFRHCKRAALRLRLLYRSPTTLSVSGYFAAGPSVSGYSVAAAGAGFAFGSKKGAQEDARHELVAASVCATHIVWARDLAEFMGFPQAAPTTLYIDNRATVALAHNPMSFSKVKHVARRHH